MDYINTFDKTINDTVGEFVMRPTVPRAVVHLLLILYATRLAPELPKTVLDLFDNQYFKLFIFAMVLWTAQFSPSTSIMIALAFMVTVNFATKKPLWEFMENTNQVEAPSKEVAVAAAESNMKPEESPKVSEVVEKETTILIQPTLNKDGNVEIPNVVVAPMVVEMPNGDKVSVTPNVSTLKVDEKVEEQGCYPVRKYDMAKVLPNDEAEYKEWSA